MSKFITIFTLAASLGSQFICAQGQPSVRLAAAENYATQTPLLGSAGMPGAAPQSFGPQSVAAQGLNGPPLAEDSALARSNNMLFYNDPHGAAPAPATPHAATVSVEQLQHPLSGKAAKLLTRAKNYAAMGRHDKAIEQLQLALKERSAVPYAHSLLGSEYLRLNQLPAAIEQLQQAVTLLPKNIPNRSNLGYALFLTGDLDGAEQQARQALELDRNNSVTQYVLAKIERARRTANQP